MCREGESKSEGGAGEETELRLISTLERKLRPELKIGSTDGELFLGEFVEEGRSVELLIDDRPDMREGELMEELAEKGFAELGDATRGCTGMLALLLLLTLACDDDR